MTSEQQAELAAKALVERKAADVKIYDVRGKSSLTDFFVVATGAAAPHLKALVAETQAAMKTAGVPFAPGVGSEAKNASQTGRVVIFRRNLTKNSGLT